jgi:PAS domain S-box-containing protein
MKDIQTDEQYQALIEHSSDIITILDDEGIIQFESPSSNAILGYDPEQLVGENAFEYIHPDDRERVKETFEEAVGATGRVTEQEAYRFRHADGSWVWLESITTNQTETALDGYVINSRDISLRKKYERELADERQKYETVVEQSHDAIAIHQDGVFVFANARCLDLLGYDEEELIGKSFKAITVPEDYELVQERYEQRLDPEVESPPQRYEARFLTKDGNRRVAELSTAHIQYEGDPAVLVAVRDITERKNYEERLENRTAELEALNRVIRHNIRNDMSIILGWMELLEDHVDEAGRDYLRKILASGEHVVELTEVVRDQVEVLTSDGEIEVTPTPLRSILETEIELRRESFPEAEFAITGEIPDRSVMANKMLGSVFRNLLNNAVQHNNTGEPFVEIGCEMRDEDVVVQIADNGPGIPDEQKETIFGKGEKGLESPGTGVGLYLVQTLISQYGGRVWVEDNDPTGAVFNIQLTTAE